MHKLKLNLDDIDVMSFESTHRPPAGRGTVRARETDFEGCHYMTEFEGCHENTDFEGCYWITEFDGCYDNTEFELCYWITEFFGCHWGPPTEV